MIILKIIYYHNCQQFSKWPSGLAASLLTFTIYSHTVMIPDVPFSLSQKSLLIALADPPTMLPATGAFCFAVCHGLPGVVLLTLFSRSLSYEMTVGTLNLPHLLDLSEVIILHCANINKF